MIGFRITSRLLRATGRSLLVAFSLSIPGMSATAQVAVPYYGPEAFVAAFEANGQAPQADRFASAAQSLVDALEALCAAPGADKTRSKRSARPQVGTAAAADAGDADVPDDALGAARAAWLGAADAWERLNAIAVGPTIERRSARTLDFRPTRPRLIKAAIATSGRGRQPPDAKALERIGTPARGLPALEWLLWDRSAPQDANACRYATGLAQAVQREAAELAAAHAAEAARDWQDEGEAASARAAEIVNQWLAGLEALRWRQLGKPLSIVATRPGSSTGTNPDIWPRPLSASNHEAWQARWEALRKLAIGPAPTDGFGPQPRVAPGTISLEALLRGRGRNLDADSWVKRVLATDDAIQALTVRVDGDKYGVKPGMQPGPQPPSAPSAPSAPPAAVATGPDAVPLPPTATMNAAVKALDATKSYMQETVAPALQVVLGFSDADGD